MKRAFLLALALAAGCGHWNEQSASFANYAEFKASKYGNGGFLPSTLVPASARGIEVKYNIDSTDIDATFTFAAADAERVVSPFRSPGQVLLHELEKDGSLPPSTAKDPTFVRCAERAVEYLHLTSATTAHYWTSRAPADRQAACKHVPAAAPGTPVIST